MEKMSLEKRLERLYSRRTFGIKPGLGTIKALLAELGDPQEKFRAIHVAGTDGKGSVCAFLDGILRQTPVRTGLYTSPHLVRLNERFKIGGVEMADDALDALVGETEEACARLVARGIPEPTFFETTTAMCALWFAREKVPLAVVEVGMGGRLDATNAFVPATCVVTRIGIDHSRYLGSTLREIAREKAGIAKPGVPIVLGEMPDEARDEILARAREVGAPAVLAGDACAVRRVKSKVPGGLSVAVSTQEADYGRADLNLAAAYQLENAATAVAAAETFFRAVGLPLRPEFVAPGLAAATLPGRFQTLCDDPPTVLDGAHNPCAAEALADSLRARKFGNVRLVCGMCADKDNAGVLRALAPLVAKVWTVPLANPRGVS
ncbi:MAG: bifunctional folylpolyglutamate synthase/dihydrofolate synthase, partial [Kiritimatiellae bacterium]|nr:bifunctional folylpolyglutamate synthase/dihydrofolate synthase [Kiritimatiellia bacterium]